MQNTMVGRGGGVEYPLGFDLKNEDKGREKGRKLHKKRHRHLNFIRLVKKSESGGGGETIKRHNIYPCHKITIFSSIICPRSLVHFV